MNIPAEAVEAAAKIIARHCGSGVNKWSWHTDEAKEVLEAAVPFMQGRIHNEGSLEQQLASARAEYYRTGRPLLDQIVALESKLMDAKRERGELFYVDYMRYGIKYTEECADRAEAENYAEALGDSGDGSVIEIRGPR